MKILAKKGRDKNHNHFFLRYENNHIFFLETIVLSLLLMSQVL